MIEVRTPARLHFGLLAYSRDDGRQFGGAGLAIQRPGALIRVKPADDGGFTATGPLADRAVEFARRFAQNAAAAGWGEVAPAAIEVVRVPRPHTGLLLQAPQDHDLVQAGADGQRRASPGLPSER